MRSIIAAGMLGLLTPYCAHSDRRELGFAQGVTTLDLARSLYVCWSRCRSADSAGADCRGAALYGARTPHVSTATMAAFEMCAQNLILHLLQPPSCRLQRAAVQSSVVFHAQQDSLLDQHKLLRPLLSLLLRPSRDASMERIRLETVHALRWRPMRNKLARVRLLLQQEQKGAEEHGEGIGSSLSVCLEE